MSLLTSFALSFDCSRFRSRAIRAHSSISTSLEKIQDSRGGGAADRGWARTRYIPILSPILQPSPFISSHLWSLPSAGWGSGEPAAAAAAVATASTAEKRARSDSDARRRRERLPWTGGEDATSDLFLSCWCRPNGASGSSALLFESGIRHSLFASLACLALPPPKRSAWRGGRGGWKRAAAAIAERTAIARGCFGKEGAGLGVRSLSEQPRGKGSSR